MTSEVSVTRSPYISGVLFSASELAVVDTPSQFWASLSADDESALLDSEFTSFKRRLAPHYFQWMYNVKSLVVSEHVSFLLRHAPKTALVRNLFHRGHRATLAGRDTSRFDRWVDSYVTRLVWSYANAVDASTRDVYETELGGTVPIFDDGHLVSQDLANSRIEWAAIKRNAGQTSFRSCLEVGAGYGRFAYLFLSINPGAAYTIVDIEPALTVSRRYLTQLFPTADLRFVAPRNMNDLAGRFFDLGVSISSLQEMTLAQVDLYLQLFDRSVADGFVYLKQWSQWQNTVDGVLHEFEKFPFPKRWERLEFDRCPIQTKFMQGVWRLSTAMDLPQRT